MPAKPALFGAPRRLVLWLLLLSLVRLAAAGLVPLTEDEAYYRLWAQHPALGYYDHPPMMAWWIHVGVRLVGDNALGARLLAVIASGLTSLVIFHTARLCGLSERVSSRAALWYNFTFLVGFGGYLIVPDAPSSFFWTLTLFCLVASQDAAKRGRSEAPFWLLAGLAAGLAMLSKYSALFLWPGVGLWLVASEGGRRKLLTPWPWLAGLVALCVFSLNLSWNLAHGMVSFQKQFGRAAAETFQPKHLVELVVTQFVLLNPFIAPLAVLGLVKAGKRWSLWLDPEALIFFLTLPFALYLGLHSLHDGVQGHWPAPLYPGLAILAADRAEDIVTSDLKGFAYSLVRAAAPTGLVLSLLAAVHMALPATDIFGKLDMSAQLRGWPQFAQRIEGLRRQTGSGWVGALSFGQAAMLEDQKAIQAPVVQINERDRYAFQPKPDARVMAGPGLVVDYSRRVTPADLLYCFGKVTQVAELDRGTEGRVLFGARPRRFGYTIYRVEAPKFNLIDQGCWESKSLADSLKRRRDRAAPSGLFK